MRILITGTNGQVGGALRQSLAGHDLLVPQRSDFDLSTPSGLTVALDRLAPEMIINPAAYTAVDRAEDETELATAVNAEAPAVLARWAAKQHAPLIHFSTDYVFDGSGKKARQEDDPVGPLSVYGRSKLAGETAVRQAGGPHLVVRTAWVYAAEGANFFRTMIRLARERPELKVVADQFGTPTSARSIASVVTGILDRGSENIPAAFARADGLIHVTNSGSASWHEFASSIVEGLRARGGALQAQAVLPILTADYPTKAKRPANSRLDLGRLNAAYGIVPLTWQDALAAELDVFLAREAGAEA